MLSPISTCYSPHHVDYNEVKAPVYSHFETAIMQLFNLERLPFLFHFHKPPYEHFLAYVQSKGSYQPNPVFLQSVLQMIQRCEYPCCSIKLQTIETNLFLQSGGLSTFSSSVAAKTKKSVSLQAQALRIGFGIEMQIEPDPVSEVPTLVEMCYKVLLKNGYPNAFLNRNDLI